jgi:hypothetical protein
VSVVCVGVFVSEPWSPSVLGVKAVIPRCSIYVGWDSAIVVGSAVPSLGADNTVGSYAVGRSWSRCRRSVLQLSPWVLELLLSVGLGLVVGRSGSCCCRPVCKLSSVCLGSVVLVGLAAVGIGVRSWRFGGVGLEVSVLELSVLEPWLSIVLELSALVGHVAVVDRSWSFCW